MDAAALELIGLLLVFTGVGAFFKRKIDYLNEREEAEYHRKISLISGMGTDDEDERIKEIKQQGYGTRWGRLKVAAETLGIAMIGGLILLYVSNTQEHLRPWSSLIFLGSLLAIYFSDLSTIHRLERRIGWLEQMLWAVKHRADDDRRSAQIRK